MSSQANRFDTVDTTGAVGEVETVFTQVVHKDTDDFTKAQGYQGQIVAPEFENRRTQHNTGNRSQQCADRDNQPVREMHTIGEGLLDHGKVIGEVAGSQHAGGIGAYCIESDIAQVEQTGKTDHDIKAER